MASAELTAEQQSPYRWVMAIVAGILMTTSFVSLTAFSIAAPDIASSIHANANTVTTLGVDSFSIGLFVAFFLGHGGLFDTRLRTGVFVAQIFLIIPQLLIPIAPSVWLITLLRFFQGLMIMMIALFSLQLSGWFRESEKALSLAFELGAITGGGALGGLLVNSMSSLSWRHMYYVTGAIMIAAAIIYFVFAKNAPTLQKALETSKQSGQKHVSAWKHPMTWILGIVQIPLTWTLFSMGGFLPTYANHLGYSSAQSGNLTFIWGISGFIAAFIGAIIGDAWAKNKKDRKGVFAARIGVITIANILMGLGALLIILIGHISFGMLVFAAIINALMMMIPPNFWACPSSVFPMSLVGAGAFGAGVISNSTSAIGPLVSSAMVPTLGWNGVFILMVVMAVIGIFINYLGVRVNARSRGEDDQEISLSSATGPKVKA